MPAKQENVKEALEWIAGILQELNIPFHVVGGLAARAYGSEREVYDIDIDIPESDFDNLANRVKEYLTFGPGSFKDPKWDLTMMTIRYKEVDIDISGADTGKIFNEQTNAWVNYPSDLKNTEVHELYGLPLPIISKDVLIDYKKLLGRPTDIEDINAMTNA